MDLQTLTDGLRNLSVGEYQWSFCPYTSKKSKDGPLLEISRCGMRDAAGLVEAVVIQLLEKGLSDRTAAPYSPFLAKEVIGMLPKTDELVAEPMADILSGVRHAYLYAAEDYLTGAAPTPTGYFLWGCREEETGETADQVLLMKRSNPFIRPVKSRLCLSEQGEAVPSTRPMLKFGWGVDLLLLGETCYILSPSVEKDLNLESRSAAITAKRLAAVAESGVVGNYEQLEKEAYKNARKFLDFDREVLEHILRLPISERADFLSEYGLTVDGGGRVDTDDPEQSGLLIDLLCGRSCHDALGRLSVGSNIMPRE